jgi:uncharacterized GH25 family protein
MRNILKVLCLSVSMIMISGLTYSHSSWIRLVKADKNNRAVFVRIAHGHKFPEGGHKLLPEFLKVYSISDTGIKTYLNMDKSGDGLSGSFMTTALGNQHFCFIYDRGVMSKTTQGWKQGGKDLYPKAIQRMKSIVCGNGFIGSLLKEIHPAGLPVELVLMNSGKEITLRLLKDAKPYANADILIQLPGKEEKLIGKTGANGEIKIGLPAEKGEMLFAAEFKITYPADQEVNVENYCATLYLNLE